MSGSGHTQSLSFLQFGDLHIRNADDENYLDFQALVEEANGAFASRIDFAYLPGDNADDGLPEQYELVRRALSSLRIPYHVIAGDHDQRNGTLENFQLGLEAQPYRTVRLREFLLVFLNAMDSPRPKAFDFGTEQMQWLVETLFAANTEGLRPLLFTHLYPSELTTRGGEFSHLVHQYGVELVAMGHTHYNELGNDGTTIYETTRSTGQIEEGPPGFSVTTITGDVIAWKFKPRGEWPLVMITSPAEALLINRPKSRHQIVRDSLGVQAKVWSPAEVKRVECRIDDGRPHPMLVEDAIWKLTVDATGLDDGTHSLTVNAETAGGLHGSDQITFLVNHAGQHQARERSQVDYENTIGPYPSKGILGTQLGPNENGTKGPWPSWR